MPRLSLYRENHSNDFKFQDNRIREVFTAGGVGINVHKYLGPKNQGQSTDLTQPQYSSQSERNIQDLLFLENRDRAYEKNVYNLRGHYTIQDNDFNLSQFGLMITNDTLYITFHINDMSERMGRKIMPGDVFELPHLRDFNPLDTTIPVALKKFYVVQETTRASEGYAQTWWPHLWRCKVTPMVDSQEFKDILDQEQYRADGTPTGGTLGDFLSSYNLNVEINNVVIAQAQSDVPNSGYSVNQLFILPTQDGISPVTVIPGYLSGDGNAPNGLPVTVSTSFPLNPQQGEYALRTDYVPARLFRYSGTTWTAIQDVQRANITGANSNTQLGTFINNSGTVKLANGYAIPSSQTLSNLFNLTPDKLG
jgi:hypothetical protein